jgi:hypothetical protein
VTADDAREAALELERQRRRVHAAALEAERRRRRAMAHAGGPLDPRGQGLWDAAAFHAARARAAAARLEEVEALVAAIRARAEAALRAEVARVRQVAAPPGEDRERPCA